MVRDLDPGRFPIASAYVEGLPNGLASHPEAQCVADVVKAMFEAFPNLREVQGVGPTLRRALQADHEDGEWTPEAVAMTLRLMARDACFASDQAYLDWTEMTAGQIFAKPIYRVLMYVLSPTLVLMGAQKRWARFRRGSTLQAGAKLEDGSVPLTLKHAEGLYSRLLLESFGVSYRAAITAAHAKDVEVDLVEMAPTEATWHLRWR